MLTRHYLYCDLGYAIIALGLSILIIFIAQKVRTTADLREITIPKSPRRFYVYATLVWLSFIPSQLFYSSISTILMREKIRRLLKIWRSRSRARLLGCWGWLVCQ